MEKMTKRVKSCWAVRTGDVVDVREQAIKRIADLEPGQYLLSLYVFVFSREPRAVISFRKLLQDTPWSKIHRSR